LCQLLAEHPDIYSDGMSSPLFSALQALRAHLSDSEFFLAQLDGQFELTYSRLQRSVQAFAAAWWNETDCPVVVDKHRGWLNQIELAMEVDPEMQMVVCVRELGQILGSIEAQHRKTVWLDFPDDLANLSPYARAEALLAPKGVVGGPLRALQAVQDRPQNLQQRLFFVVFEHLMGEPEAVMAELFAWLGVNPLSIDPQNLTVRSSEADSYYRFKYRHQTHSQIQPPRQHWISPRVAAELKQSYRWFYELFYPGLLEPTSSQST
jgi:sulfotransferase